MDKKQLYESIMASVAKEVKKALNEDEYKSPINTTLGNNNTKNLLNLFNNIKHSLGQFNEFIDKCSEKNMLSDELCDKINGGKGSYISNISIILKQMQVDLENELEKLKIS